MKNKILLITLILLFGLSITSSAQNGQTATGNNGSRDTMPMQGHQGGTGPMSGGHGQMQREDGTCPGMMGGMQGRGGFHARMMGDFQAPIDQQEAQEIARRYVLYTRNNRLTVGKIRETDQTFEIPIVTKKENALVNLLYIDKKTGFMWSE